jgi:hypothetical protein
MAVRLSALRVGRALLPRKIIVRLEGLGQLKKNPMTSSGLETVTFRFVAYPLNQLRYRVPLRKVERTHYTTSQLPLK